LCSDGKLGVAPKWGGGGQDRRHGFLPWSLFLAKVERLS